MSISLSTFRIAIIGAPILENVDPNVSTLGVDNVVPVSGLTVTSEDPDNTADNLKNTATNLQWCSLTAGSQSITIETPGTTGIDYIALSGHNFAGAIVQIDVNGSTEPAGDPPAYDLISQVTVTETQFNRTAKAYFEERLYTSIRLDITMLNGTLEKFCIGSLFVGKVVRLPNQKIYVDHTPPPYAVQTKGYTAFSTSGQYLGKVVTSRQAQTRITWDNIDPGVFRSQLAPALRAMETSPFYFSWRPGKYPNEVVYAALVGDPEVVNQRPNGMMQVSFTLRTIGQRNDV